MFPLFPLLAGAGVGALTSKNPVKGALFGGGLGYAGGAVLPGLLGGAPGVVAEQAAAPVADAAFKTVAPEAVGMSVGEFLHPTQINLASSGAAGLTQSAAPVMDAATKPVGLLGQINSTAKEYAPLASAAGTGMQVAGMFGGEQQAAPPQAPNIQQQMVGGNQTLSSIANAGTQKIQQELAAADQQRQQRRMMRRGLLA